MGALTFSTSPALADSSLSLEKMRAKFGPLAVVIAIHLVLFYLAYSGTLTRMVDTTLQQAVMVTFVAPPAPPKAPPLAAKVVPAAKVRPPVLPAVPLPAIVVATQPNPISVTHMVVPVEKTPTPSAPAAAGPVPMAAPAPAPAPKTMTVVEFLSPPQPMYPAMSKRMGEQGKVVLRVLVNENGKADQVDIQTSSGSARLDEAGRQAVLRAHFKPYRENGRSIAGFATVPVTFQLAS